MYEVEEKTGRVKAVRSLQNTDIIRIGVEKDRVLLSIKSKDYKLLFFNCLVNYQLSDGLEDEYSLLKFVELLYHIAGLEGDVQMEKGEKYNHEKTCFYFRIK